MLVVWKSGLNTKTGLWNYWKSERTKRGCWGNQILEISGAVTTPRIERRKERRWDIQNWGDWKREPSVSPSQDYRAEYKCLGMYRSTKCFILEMHKWIRKRRFHRYFGNPKEDLLRINVKTWFRTMTYRPTNPTKIPNLGHDLNTDEQVVQPLKMPLLCGIKRK